MDEITQVAMDIECLFLTKIPLEIRNKIYKLLLVRVKLGYDLVAAECEIPEDVYSMRMGLTSNIYGMSPAILRTCRKINTEALPILYGTNKFFIDCHPDFYESPLTRGSVEARNVYETRELVRARRAFGRSLPDDPTYAGGEAFFDYQDLYNDMSAITPLIKHWVIHTMAHDLYLCTCTGFKKFCDAIKHTRPISMEIWIDGLGKMQKYNPTPCHPLTEIFRPLDNFRRLKSITFRGPCADATHRKHLLVGIDPELQNLDGAAWDDPITTSALVEASLSPKPTGPIQGHEIRASFGREGLTETWTIDTFRDRIGDKKDQTTMQHFLKLFHENSSMSVNRYFYSIELLAGVKEVMSEELMQEIRDRVTGKSPSDRGDDDVSDEDWHRVYYGFKSTF